MDPAPDPGGPKKRGSGGSGSRRPKNVDPDPQHCLRLSLLWVLVDLSRPTRFWGLGGTAFARPAVLARPASLFLPWVRFLRPGWASTHLPLGAGWRYCLKNESLCAVLSGAEYDFHFEAAPDSDPDHTSSFMYTWWNIRNYFWLFFTAMLISNLHCFLYLANVSKFSKFLT